MCAVRHCISTAYARIENCLGALCSDCCADSFGVLDRTLGGCTRRKLGTVNTMAFVWIISGSVVAGLLAVLYGFLPPPHASTLIRVSGGKVRINRGEMRPHAKVQVTEVL